MITEITRRLLIAQGILSLGLGSVLLMPRSGARPQPAGITLDLPERVGLSWRAGAEMPVTERERQVLAADTGFARRVYTNPFGDQAYVGIVLSGVDMADSIHRPERCLPAQGWTVARSERLRLPSAGGGGTGSGEPMEVTRLHNVRAMPTPDGRTVSVRNLTYYWFVGSRDRTASHWTRTFLDMRDRLQHGENQRWAYVTVAATVTEGLTRNGRSEAETEQFLEELIPQVAATFRRPEPETPGAVAPVAINH